MGLATVYGIVKQAGGYIQVQSELDQGSVFKIYWPRVENTQFAPEKTIENVLPQGHEVVLLVEVEPDVRNLLRDYLDEIGYTVLEAATGEEALEVAQQHPASIDVLITDVVLSAMSGKDLADRLAVQQPQMRVLYLSGYSEMDIVAPHQLSDPETNYLQKPFALDVLGRKMRDILDAGEGNEIR